MIGLVTDDTLIVGSGDFFQLEQLATKIFDGVLRNRLSLHFSMVILKNPFAPQDIAINQKDMIEYLEFIPTSRIPTMTEFRSGRGKSIYVVQNNRPKAALRASFGFKGIVEYSWYLWLISGVARLKRRKQGFIQTSEYLLEISMD